MRIFENNYENDEKTDEFVEKLQRNLINITIFHIDITQFTLYTYHYEKKK